MEPTDINRRMFDEAHRRAGSGRTALPAIVRQTLLGVSGKTVLHLHSGSGEGSAELAELGAVVTAVDPDEALLEPARERWPSILWIAGDAQALPANLRRGRFDLVYSPEGVIGRLTDVDAWAAGVAAAVRRRGELLVFDDHPVALCVDGLLRWNRDYFDDGIVRLGRLVSALARAGFRVEALEEYPLDASGRRHDRRVPGSFLLYAVRA
ncbi:MAG: methyltransferase domain-containing protein [Actinobacteria bacterium]|nr:methyltransferase domain-containing protein [Actinomycetota bacterium]MBV8480300.1 methyltransferase domain-containing protein [Actinomycetota bacterium]MBV8599275.1 methyltransferase domain-containing protein [Actinomycetota bacterium]